MTVISAFSIADTAALVGDLLLSGSSETKAPELSIPAVGRVDDFFGGADGGWQILGLRQKVVLISPKCVIGWAGSWLQARVIVADLRSLAGQGPLTVEQIGQYLCNTTEQIDDLSLVGWVARGERFVKFNFNAETFSVDGVGQVMAGGTGADAVREYFNFRPSFTSVTGATSSLHEAFFHGVMMAILFLRAELHGGDAAATIRNSFGGGYEIACSMGGEFRKLSDVAFLVWRIDLSDPNHFNVALDLSIKQQYQDDTLLLRSARWTRDETGRPAQFDEQFHAVPPMYGAGPLTLPPTRESMPFSSSSFVHCFLVQKGEKFGIAGMYHSQTRSDQTYFQLKETESDLSFFASASFKQAVKNAAFGLQLD
ncbi:hypothetical protein [Variovorax sp. KK3]|uniref:hypothetical protein n=1 Tax=Variovorax sp. KK3 TaxID=1855728 RepID=UPI0011805019|nr:hypothetical protein [Variovorax sp. KK3]